MLRMMGALAQLYRRWRYVEEDSGPAAIAGAAPVEGELLRTRRAIERREQQLTDYRRNGCVDLARDCETSLRSLRTHLAALEL